MPFPDAEEMLRNFLIPVAAPHRVVLTVPSTRPETFVRLWRSGGTMPNRILDLPQMTIEAWSTRGETASDLASVLRDALVNEYTRMPLVRGVSDVIGPYSTPDPDTETPRYRFSATLTVRASRA